MASQTKNTTSMTEGTIWKSIVAFAIPLFLGNLFQQLYNMADSLIVGNFLGSNALAAVSSSGNLIFLLVGFFNGIAVGAGVVIARYFGAREKESLQRSIHTTIAFGLICGIVLSLVGVIFAPKILILMGTPDEVLPKFNGLFSGLFCRLDLFRHVQYFCRNPSGRRRFQTSALLPDHLLHPNVILD